MQELKKLPLTHLSNAEEVLRSSVSSTCTDGDDEGCSVGAILLDGPIVGPAVGMGVGDELGEALTDGVADGPTEGTVLG